MNTRLAARLVAALLIPAAVGGAAWWWEAGADTPAPVEDAAPLPVPPLPTRIAEGEDYDRCLAMLNDDPAGANAFAEAWEATGGGDGAAHCHALAQIALGNAETGAEMMQHLADASHAPPAARASIYGQAGQAWMMAGDPGRAYGAATLALALSPDDPDLLVDRAVAAAALERFADAAEDLDHALAVDPTRVDALVDRGAAERQLGRLDLAEEDIGRALALDPDNAEALLERGILRQRRGDPAGAREDWERAAALSPDSATADLAEQNLALLAAGPNRP